MAEVRFKIKGQQQETVFSPIVGEDDKVYLYARLPDGKEEKILLVQDEKTLVFSLEDKTVFEEPYEVIEERLLGLSTEWMDEQEQGFESESSDEEIPQPGYGPDDIFVENKPFSLKQFNDLIEEGDIELAPDFQRNFIWDETRQSRLIESLLLGLPLPSIYLSQYGDGRLTIVDGLQRIMTIRRFLNDKLRLSNLEYIGECNGMNYSQLKEHYSPLRMRRFGQTQIMCFVIDYRSPNKLKFDLFRRLNTGGKPLNNQEIRNCLSRRELRDTLREMVGTTAFKQATGGSVKDTRMEAQESALRFLCFFEQYGKLNEGMSFYNGNMEETLDEAVEFFNEFNGLEKFIPVYEQVMKDAYSLFGDQTFRKVFYGQSRRSPVNKLLMLSVSVLLAKYGQQYRAKIDSGVKLTDALKELMEKDETLFNALTWSTNSKWNIVYTFNALKGELFDKNLL